MKFKYDNPWNVQKTYHLKKFKNGASSSKEHIYLTLERNLKNPEKIHIFVRAKETKVILFQGFGMKNITDKVSNFMNKDQNVKFSVIKQQEKENEEDLKPQFVKEELKLQFGNIEDANDFKEYISK